MSGPTRAPVPRWRGEIPWPYSVAERWADATIHMAGVSLAVAGAVFFAVSMTNQPGSDKAAVAVYLTTLLTSITVSAAYNIWPVSRIKWALRRLDHSAIYLLIAGTYTPFLVKIGMLPLLAMVWIVALAGIALKLLFPGRFDRFSIVLYLALGWNGVLVLNRMATALPANVLWLIGAGGLFYSLGVVFHVWERLRFQNAIWHAFVLTAATIHYAAVWAAMSSMVAAL